MPNPHGLRYPWTEQQIADLLAAVEEKLSAGQIAARLKVSRATIIGKLDRMGVSLHYHKRGQIVPRRLLRGLPRDTLSHAQRPTFEPPSPPRRFSWQEPLDGTREHA